MMPALVWHGPRRMTLERLPRPQPGPGEVRLRVTAVGICGSELSGYLGRNALRVPPLVMGHEFTGVVEALGPPPDPGERATPAGAVTTSGSAPAPAVGERVVVNPLVSCGRCAYCLSGRANLCRERRLVGAHRPGAFAEAVVVPAASCLPLPEGVDAVTGSLAEPLACAVRAVRLAGAGPESRLRVIGAGPIGLLCALVAREAGARDVTVHEPNRTRAAVAASWRLDAPEAPPEPGSAVVDAVGLEATRRQALAALEPGGTAVFVGLHEASAAFDGNDLVREEKTVRGCFAYAPEDFARALDLLGGGLLPAPGDWLSVRGLADGKAAFDELVGTMPSVVKIVLRPYGAAEEG